MTSGNAREWTVVQRILGVGGVMLFALALERLINAALVRDATTLALALGFSVVFALMGVVALTAVVVMRVFRPTSPRAGDRRGAGASDGERG